MFLWTGVLDRSAYALRATLVIAFMATANLMVPALCGETSGEGLPGFPTCDVICADRTRGHPRVTDGAFHCDSDSESRQ